MEYYNFYLWVEMDLNLVNKYKLMYLNLQCTVYAYSGTIHHFYIIV